MKIWVDADACPVVIKEILFRAAERTQTFTTLVANHAMRVPPLSLLAVYKFLRVLILLTTKSLNVSSRMIW